MTKREREEIKQLEKEGEQLQQETNEVIEESKKLF